MKDPIKLEAVNLRNADRKKMTENTQTVKCRSQIHKESITEAKLLILSGANIVVELLGKKRSKRENKKIPWWKRYIQTIIAESRRHVAQLQEWNRRKLSKN